MAFRPAPQLISEHGQVKPTPGKTPVAKKTVLPPPPTKRKPSYTPAQEATIHARQLLAPQYQQADVEAQRQNQAIQAYTTAVMQQLAGLAPSVGQPFTQAANAQEGMVNAAANSLRAVNPSGDVANLLNAVGAPQSQLQQIQGNLNNTFNGGAAVGQYVGSLPIGTLRSEGATAEALAKLQPGFTALAGRQSLASALKQQADARAQIGMQLPKLQQDWLSSFQSNKAKQQQLALEQNALGLKTQNQTFNQNAKVASLKLQQDKFLAQQQKQIKDGTRIDASASRAAGYMIDKNGQPILKNGKRQILPGFNTNAQGRVVKNRATKAAAAAQQAQAFPNLTKTQIQHLRAGIANVFYGVPAKYKITNGKKVLDTPALPPATYQQAITEAVKHGYSRAAATRMANRFYQPGQRGRPGKATDSSGLGITVPPLVK